MLTAVGTSEWHLLLCLHISLDLRRLRLSLIAMSVIIKCSILLNTYRVQIVMLSKDVVSVPSVRMVTYKTGPAETVV